MRLAEPSPGTVRYEREAKEREQFAAGGKVAPEFLSDPCLNELLISQVALARMRIFYNQTNELLQQQAKPSDLTRDMQREVETLYRMARERVEVASKMVREAAERIAGVP